MTPIRRSSNSRRSRTDRWHRSVAPPWRHESLRLRSSPTGSPSNSGLSTWRGPPQPRSRPRRPCGLASRRRNARVACRCSAASLWSAQPRRQCWPSQSGSASLGSETSGEQFHAALAPTDVVPGATGEATLTKTDSGWKIELDATGLPRLEGGRFYQAWLRNAAGVLVPIGTFNEGRDVTLWAGVSPKDFTTLTVTREQADERAGLVRREGARRNRRYDQLTSRRRRGAPPAGGRGRDGSSPCPHGPSGLWLPPCRRGR